MIVWLASYPRSGNTLLRTMIHRVFGLPTHSIYDDRGDIGADEATTKAVGHAFLGGSWDERYPQLRDAAEVAFVKTHDGPTDDEKAVYVVRDPRAAIASYFHYLKDFRPDWAGCTIRDVASGVVPFGPWSYHLDRWNPLERPRTLLLRYEDLLTRPQQAIERLAQFCYLPAKCQWNNDFAGLHRVNPRFFRQGSATFDRSEYDEDSLLLLDALHGDWMDRLGYQRAEHARYFSVERRAFRAVICDGGTQVDRLRAEKAQLYNELSAAAARLVEAAVAGEEHRAVAQRLEAAEETLTNAKTELESLRAQLLGKERHVAALLAQLAAREAQLATQINQLATKEQQYAHAELQRTETQRQLAEQQTVLAAKDAQIAELHAEVSQLSGKLAAAESALAGQTEQLALRTAERDAAAAGLAEVRSANTELATRLAEKLALIEQHNHRAAATTVIVEKLEAALAQFNDIGPRSLGTVRRIKRLLNSFPRTRRVARRIVDLALRGTPSPN
jgi:hypothetical protein